VVGRGGDGSEAKTLGSGALGPRRSERRSERRKKGDRSFSICFLIFLVNWFFDQGEKTERFIFFWGKKRSVR
jgi:hypothetical protein